MRKKILLLFTAAVVLMICCSCSNTLESFAGSYFNEADVWTADEKSNTFVNDADTVHFAGNYVTFTHVASAEETMDKTQIAKFFVDLSDAAGITNGTVDYTYLVDEAATEHFTMNYQEAKEVLGE